MHACCRLTTQVVNDNCLLILLYYVSEIILKKEWEERGWLIWGRRGGQHIKILLALKDRAYLTLLPVREKWFWSGKSQEKVREF